MKRECYVTEKPEGVNSTVLKLSEDMKLHRVDSGDSFLEVYFTLSTITDSFKISFQKHVRWAGIIERFFWPIRIQNCHNVEKWHFLRITWTVLLGFNSELFMIRLTMPIAVMLVSIWPHADDALLWTMYNIWRIEMELKSHLMYGAMWPAQEQLLPLNRRELLKVRYILMTVMKMLLEAHNNELPVINYTSLVTRRKRSHCLNEKCKRCEFKVLFWVFISLKLKDYYSSTMLPTSALGFSCGSSPEYCARFLVYC